MERLGWLEILDRHGDVVQRHAVGGWPLWVGRGYDCDVVLDDPCVAPRHLAIGPAPDGGYQLDAGDSLNGVAVGTAAAGAQAVAGPDDVWRIGHTRLRLRPCDYVVAPERACREVDGWLGWWGLAGLFSLFLIVNFATLWGGYNRDDVYGIFVQPLLGLGLVALLWTGFWALMSRVFRGAAHFVRHAGIALLGFMALTVQSGPLPKYLGFALDLSPLVSAVSGWLAPALFGAMLYAHLILVSRIRRRYLGGAVVALMLLGIGYGRFEDVWKEEARLTRLEFSQVIGPAQFQLSQGVSPDAFMVEARALRARLSP